MDTRAAEQAIRKKRNEAANALIRGTAPEQQERDASGKFFKPPPTGQGMDGGSRGGVAIAKSGDWLGNRLRGEN